MEWPVVQKRIQKIWPKITKLLPERKPAPGPKFEYEDMRVFEAALYMVWHNHSMRNRLPGRYPSPNPLYLRIAAMVRSRALDAAWKAYLEKASQDELRPGRRPLGASRPIGAPPRPRCGARSGWQPERPSPSGQD